LTLLVVAAGGWYLGLRLLGLVVFVAVFLRVVAVLHGDLTPGTGASQALGALVIGIVTQGAARQVIGSRRTQEQERQVRELTLLLETAQRLASLEKDVIITEAVESTQALLSAQPRATLLRVSFHRVEGDHARIVVEREGARDVTRDYRYPLSASPGSAEAVRSGRAVVQRAGQLSREMQATARESGAEVGTLVPVKALNRVVGFLVATSKEPGLDQSAIRVMEVLAQLTGLALGNADVVDRERAHSERMESLERTKTEFLRLASHELRAPLTVIRGYIAMLDEGSLGELPVKTRELAMPILTTKVQEMSTLIEQMLETARLEDNRMHLKLERLDLTSVLRDAARTAEPLAGHDHPIRVEEPATVVPVLADRARLGIILTNLIDNAVKYSPAGGAVRCSLEARDGLAVVQVSDRGIGIAPEDQARLFSLFGRIVTPENSHIPGTGLGLYLSRELARLHGGDITLESSVGRGSAFTVTLPLAPDAGAGAVPGGVGA
jgi:signal transduction histidine kinase